MLTPGTVLSGRYELTERIAAGGMGEVWRGTDVLLHRGVAIKVLLPTLMADAEFAARFRREARVMAALRHPGIVQVYDYGESAEVGGYRIDYLVMEYVDGQPLAKRIQAAGRLSVAETMTMVAQVADALQEAHDAGIVHRDVKPSNLLVRPNGALVLVDFGVARSAGVEGLTSTNVVLGSAHYMSPEQAEGKPVTATTDVYALGAVAYCCLAGRPPYVGEHPLQVLAQLVTGDPPTLPVEIPPQAAALVLRALEKNPARRFPTAAALAEAARSVPRFTSAPAGPGPAMGHRPSPTPPMGHSPASGQSFGQRPASGQSFGQGPASGQSFGQGSASAQPPGPRAAWTSPMGQGPASTPPGGYGPAFAPAAVPVPMFPTGSPISGPPISGPPISAAPMSGSPGSGDGRRRTTLVAVAAAAVAVAVVGIGTAIAMRPGTSEAGTHDGPDLGLAEQRQNPGGNPAGRGPGAISLPALPPNSKSARPRPSATSTAPAGTGPSTSVSADPTEPTATATTTAATNPYTAKQACGSAFSVIDQAALKNTAGTVLGRVYLLYNSSTGKNCTVTLKTTDVGTATAATAYLEVEGSTRVTDSGNFTYYAGPVKAAANGVCVKWGGSIQGAAYDSPFEHCD